NFAHDILEFDQGMTVVAATKMRNSGGDHCVTQRFAGGNAQTAIVHECATATLGCVKLIHCRVVDHAGHDLALTLERDRNGKDRNAVKEVGRSVEWVNDPAVLIVL